MNKPSFYKRIITGSHSSDSPIKNRLFTLLQLLFRIFDKFYFDNCLIRASGLAFNSLLALVPLSAIILAFGGLRNVSSSLQDFLVRILLPSSLNQIIDALNMFTENSAKLGTYGMILFLITIVFLMNNIENNLNSIWLCRKKRNFFQQFTIYTTVLVFGSLLIGGNFSISSNLLAIIPNYAETLNNPLLIQIGYRISSITFITLTLMLLILMIPSVKVAISSALTGALTGAVLWELSKWGFKTWANYSVRNSVIYGSLFLIPLLLVWLYVVWLIIMVTMETAYIHNHRFEPHIRYNDNTSLSDSFAIRTDLYIQIARAYYNKEKTASLSTLTKEAGITENEVNKFINQLIGENLIVKSEDGTYLPFSPPDSLKVFTLYSKISGIEGYKRKSAADFLSGAEKELNNRTVSDLIKHNDE
jgi:membrane protein